MSHTLNKLKQSEIDHGLRRPPQNKSKPPQGLMIAFFVIILSVILVLINFGEEFFSEQQTTASKNTIASSSNKNRTISLTDLQKKVEIDNKIAVKKEVKLAPESKEKEVTEKKASETLLTNRQLEFLPSSPEIREPQILEPEIMENLGLSNIGQDNTVTKEELVKQELIETQPENENLSPEDPESQPALIPEIKPELWQNLSTNFKKSLPKMEVNGITFFEKEEDRFVFINMTKYERDDIVEKGPSIEEIRKDSIVMYYKNKLFIFPSHK